MTMLWPLLIVLGVLALLAGCDNAAPYERRNGSWHFDDRPLGDGHVERLTVLNKRFAKNTDTAYYRATPIDGADTATFEALDEHHARDRARVWFADTYRVSQDYFTSARVRVKTIEGADAASFRLLREGHARDRWQVYYEGQRFAVRDVDSFEVLDYGFARDRVSAYYLRTPVPGSDGASFTVLDAHHALDATQVFHADLDYSRSGAAAVRIRRIDGADRASFRPLEGGYAVDARRVYWQGRPIPGAEPASFTLISPGSGSDADARDARRRFQRGQALPVVTS